MLLALPRIAAKQPELWAHPISSYLKALTMISRRQLLAATAVSAVVSPWAASQALAQNAQPVRLIVGFAAGGSADYVARQLSQQLGQELGTSVIVENRPGAGGRIAVEAVKNAKPDGNTLLVTPGAILTIYPHVYDKLSYDSVADLAPIANLCEMSYSLNIGPWVPESVKTLKDFGEWLKTNPNMASYGSAGAGTAMHFLGAMYAAHLGIEYLHVPFKGGVLALQDVMAGQLPSSFNVASEAVAQIGNPKVRTLAVTSKQRMPQFPNVPTFAEQGLDALTSSEWMGLLAPKGTPVELVQRLHAAAARSVSHPKVQQALAEMAFTVNQSSTAEFAGQLKKDIAKWAPVVQKTGFKAGG